MDSNPFDAQPDSTPSLSSDPVLAPWLRKYDRFWQHALERLRDAVEEDAGADSGRTLSRQPRRRKRK